MPPANSLTDAIWPSISTLPLPSAETFLETTTPSWSSGEVKKRASTLRASVPSLTAEASARSPTKSLIEDKRAVLPAPVSPVKTVKPEAGAREASSISATFCTRSSSSIYDLLTDQFYRKTREKLNDRNYRRFYQAE